jgi:hypothetical protein
MVWAINVYARQGMRHAAKDLPGLSLWEIKQLF